MKLEEVKIGEKVYDGEHPEWGRGNLAARTYSDLVLVTFENVDGFKHYQEAELEHLSYADRT